MPRILQAGTHRIQAPLSNKRVTWVACDRQEDLDEHEQQELGLLRQASATAGARSIIWFKDLGQMVRQHKAD
ncbi:hypothetical protein, partial [Dictyobacter vulcani]|uniref:hypothetical protein n=1 Tax=Dictyobacter vulcani TaxID=2607529 RepID=UPI001E374A06